MRNPWLHLPKSQPHILSEDLEVLKRFNVTPEKLGLRLEIFPVPYIGNLNEAKIVLLCLNPGFNEQDIVVYENEPEFNQESLNSLTFNSSPPFFYLDQKFNYTEGYKWWSKILNKCIKKFDVEAVSKKIMCLQYIPYHSVTFTNPPSYLESQKFTFNLLKEAINEKKVIIIMRSKKLWIKAVPELEDYPYIELKNFRRPFISKRNMKDGDFEKIIKALTG